MRLSAFSRRRGFRCVNATELRFLDGTQATVRAHSHEQSKERPDATARQKRALMLYELRRGNEIEFIDDLELETRLGHAAFSAQPIVDLSVYIGRLVTVREKETGRELAGFLQSVRPDTPTAPPFRVRYSGKNLHGAMESRELSLQDNMIITLEQGESGTPILVIRGGLPS